MRPGRKSKPTALKLLEGNPGGRKLREDELQYPVLKLENAPSDLTEDGRRCWFELGNQLCAIGLLQTVDSNVFWRYCEIFSRWLLIKRFIQSLTGTPNNPTGILQPVTEQVYRANEKGALVPLLNPDNTPVLRIKYYKTRPEVGEFHRLSETLRKLENELGLNPSARTKLYVRNSGGRFSDPGEDEDPFA